MYIYNPTIKFNLELDSYTDGHIIKSHLRKTVLFAAVNVIQINKLWLLLLCSLWEESIM
jgi:hypothetical protein